MRVINYENFMKDKTNYYDNTLLSYVGGIKLLGEKSNNYDMVSYDDLIKISITNYYNYYYDYEFTRDCDIISNFTFYNNDPNIRLVFLIGNNYYEINELEYFLFVSCMYEKLKLRILFNEKPIINKEINIKIKKHLCNTNLRKQLMTNIITTKINIYNHGICMKN